MILQAFDFYQLFKKKNCILQIGGSDQWGNIVNGVDLIRRILKKESFGLTSPLDNFSIWCKNGKKTEKGAIWLNKDLFSPYDYWQFWRNTDDRDVKRFLNFFTEIKTSEIDEICRSEKNINKLENIISKSRQQKFFMERSLLKKLKTARETFEGSGLKIFQK